MRAHCPEQLCGPAKKVQLMTQLSHYQQNTTGDVCYEGSWEAGITAGEDVGGGRTEVEKLVKIFPELDPDELLEP